MVDDVVGALARGRNCLVLTQRTAHVAVLADLLRAAGHDPVVLRGGMGAGQRRSARLLPDAGPLLLVATGPYVGEGFDCPVLSTLFLAAPIAFKGRLVQHVGRVLRGAPGREGHGVEVHDYHDIETGVLASSLPKRAPGYTSRGSPDPRTTRHHPPSCAGRALREPYLKLGRYAEAVIAGHGVVTDVSFDVGCSRRVAVGASPSGGRVVGGAADGTSLRRRRGRGVRARLRLG